jgi:hypothetical protein
MRGGSFADEAGAPVYEAGAPVYLDRAGYLRFVDADKENDRGGMTRRREPSRAKTEAIRGPASRNPRLTGEQRTVLEIWEKVTRRSIKDEWLDNFLTHPALDRILESLEKTGPEHFERIAGVIASRGSLRLDAWAAALTDWARRRRDSIQRGNESLAAIEGRERKIWQRYGDEGDGPVSVEKSAPSGRHARRPTHWPEARENSF